MTRKMTNQEIETVYSKYGAWMKRKVYSMAYRCDELLALEVINEVLNKFFMTASYNEDLSPIDDPKFKAYLSTVLNSCFRDYIRHNDPELRRLLQIKKLGYKLLDDLSKETEAGKTESLAHKHYLSYMEAVEDLPDDEAKAVKLTIERNESGKYRSGKEIANEMGVSTSEYYKIFRKGLSKMKKTDNIRHLISLYFQDKTTVFIDPERIIVLPSVLDDIIRAELSQVIATEVDRLLTEKEKMVLYDLFFLGEELTGKEIAEKYNISEPRVCALKKTALEKLRRSEALLEYKNHRSQGKVYTIMM